jgi:hypothetical protein
MSFSGWYLCQTVDYKVMKGKYFGVFSVNQIELQKVAIYSQEAIQINPKVPSNWNIGGSKTVALTKAFRPDSCQNNA